MQEPDIRCAILCWKSSVKSAFRIRTQFMLGRPAMNMEHERISSPGIWHTQAMLSENDSTIAVFPRALFVGLHFWIKTPTQAALESAIQSRKTGSKNTWNFEIILVSHPQTCSVLTWRSFLSHESTVTLHVTTLQCRSPKASLALRSTFWQYPLFTEISKSSTIPYSQLKWTMKTSTSAGNSTKNNNTKKMNEITPWVNDPTKLETLLSTRQCSFLCCLGINLGTRATQLNAQDLSASWCSCYSLVVDKTCHSRKIPQKMFTPQNCDGEKRVCSHEANRLSHMHDVSGIILSGNPCCTMTAGVSALKIVNWYSFALYN